jgi:putative membrane protein
MKNLKLLVLSLVVIILVGVSCSQVKQASHAPTDRQITKAVTTVNDGEITLARYVLDHSQNQEVRDFARHMVTDHSNNNKKTMALANEYNLNPASSHRSETLRKEGMRSQEEIMGLNGIDLDRAYIDIQITTHKKVLREFEDTLIPAAKNSELKAHLEMTAEKVEEHLNHAKDIQTRL